MSKEPTTPFGSNIAQALGIPSQRIDISFLKEMGFVYSENWPYNNPSYKDLMQHMQKEINGKEVIVTTCHAFTRVLVDGKEINISEWNRDLIIKEIDTL